MSSVRGTFGAVTYENSRWWRYFRRRAGAGLLNEQSQLDDVLRFESLGP